MDKLLALTGCDPGELNTAPTIVMPNPRDEGISGEARRGEACPLTFSMRHSYSFDQENSVTCLPYPHDRRATEEHPRGNGGARPSAVSIAVSPV